MAKKIKIPSKETDITIDDQKKPAKSIKPMTQREFELNKNWYESEEYRQARIKYWTDEKGNLINNPFILK